MDTRVLFLQTCKAQGLHPVWQSDIGVYTRGIVNRVAGYAPHDHSLIYMAYDDSNDNPYSLHTMVDGKEIARAHVPFF